MTRTSNPLAFTMKCAECIHFRGIKSPAFKSVCSDLGTKHYANACRHFTADVHRLARVEADALSSVATLVSGCDNSQLRLMSMALMGITDIRKAGYEFGQTLWFNLSAPREEYVDCYYRGVIVAVADGNLIIASDLSGDMRVSITLPPSSVLTHSQWEKRLAKLVKANRICMPVQKNGHKLRLVAREALVVTVDYEVPTLETAPKELVELAGGRKRRPVKKVETEVEDSDSGIEDDSGIEVDSHSSGSMVLSF